MRHKTPIGESRATLKAIKSFKFRSNQGSQLEAQINLSYTHTDLVGNGRNLRQRTLAIPQTKPRPKHESRETDFAWVGGETSQKAAVT